MFIRHRSPCCPRFYCRIDVNACCERQLNGIGPHALLTLRLIRATVSAGGAKRLWFSCLPFSGEEIKELYHNISEDLY